MARFYLYFEKVSYKIDPRKFYSCPTECSKKGFSITRYNFCDGCDQKKHADKMRKDVMEEWQKKLGPKARRFKYDEVLKLFYSVIRLENSPQEKLTVKMALLLGVYLSEVNRKKRIELWDAERESK